MNEVTKQKREIVTCIADIPFRVVYEYEENGQFFKDYATKRQPLFDIKPEDEDLKSIKRLFDQAAVHHGDRFNYGLRLLENNAIHALVAEKMLDYDVLLIHGSALCMDGEAYIFIAPSGTGKSTHTRLWREFFGERVWMINDDKPMMKIRNDDILVYGTPWDGKHHLSTNAYAPLKAIVWLNRDETNHIERMSKAEAFPVIKSQTYNPRNKKSMLQVMTLQRTILNCIPVYKLFCNQNSDAAFVAWQGINE